MFTASALYRKMRIKLSLGRSTVLRFSRASCAVE